jgi:hypothetical protein
LEVEGEDGLVEGLGREAIEMDGGQALWWWKFLSMKIYFRQVGPR